MRDRLKSLYERHHYINYAQFAQDIGIAQSTVAKYMKAIAYPSNETLEKLHTLFPEEFA